jgi:PAS domain S-box-containing protein
MQVLVSAVPSEHPHPDWRAMAGCRSFITSPSFQHGAEPLTLTLASREEGWSGSVARPLLVELTSLLALHFEAWSARDALGRINAELEQRVLDRTRALRESEERFQRFFEEAPQAMLVVELSSGLITQSNARASALFGHSPEEFHRLPIDELVPEDLRATHGVHRAGFSSGPATARAMSNRTFAARHRDGRSFDVEIGLVRVADQAIVGLTDVSERVAAMEALRRSIAEKETLLREVHHRVKNNLQIVTSLLEMQQSGTDDAKALGVIREAAGRVRAMALVHQSLYQSESLDRVELDAYLRRIVTGLQSSIGSSARIDVSVAPVQVAIEVAVPLGLLVNELLTNAFKYGARKGAEGAEVRLGLEGQGRHFTLVVHDAGPGLPPGADSDRPKTLGLKLARALARQIGARLTYTYDQGSRFLVEAETSVPLDRGRAL